ncbi:MAG TPA: CapA family protein [Gemmatimonadales bacterium]|nr:CapA family protein [Gemmatimonadales bacterium]
MSRASAALTFVVGLAACGGNPAPPTPAPARADSGAPPPSAILPAPVPPPPPRAVVRLAFTGDINLGTLTLPGGVPPDSGRGLLDAAAPALRGDLVVGNFEGVLGDSGTTYKCSAEGRRVTPADTIPPPPDSMPRPGRRGHRPARPEPPKMCYAFLTPPWLAPRLRDAGFTHLNLANNHAGDFGPEARDSSAAMLHALGLATYGLLDQIAIDTLRRGDSVTTVGLIGFTTYPFAYDLLDIPRSVAVVDSVRRLVDLLVVTFHGGAEGSRALHVPEVAESLGQEPRGELRLWAHAVVDAGADAVVGHGPHVLRGIEVYRGRPIAYSLGNFLTYRGFNLSGPLGVTGVLQLELAPGDGLRRARLLPMLQRPGEGPAPDPGGAALELVRRLSAEDFPGTAARVTEDGALLPAE